MFGSMLKKLIGSSNDREIRKMRKTVNKINALEENLKTLSDTELKAQTPVFRERLAAGETLEQILPGSLCSGSRDRLPSYGYAPLRCTDDWWYHPASGQNC